MQIVYPGFHRNLYQHTVQTLQYAQEWTDSKMAGLQQMPQQINNCLFMFFMRIIQEMGALDSCTCWWLSSNWSHHHSVKELVCRLSKNILSSTYYMMITYNWKGHTLIYFLLLKAKSEKLVHWKLISNLTSLFIMHSEFFNFRNFDLLDHAWSQYQQQAPYTQTL